MKIKILTDSSMTISESYIKENNIEVVPIKLSWEEKGVNGLIKSDKMFKLMRESDDPSSPKTSQPSMGDYKKFFEENLNKNNIILCLCLSSKISGTYNSAIQALKFFKKEEQKRIFVIDTLQTDAGLGLMVLKTNELIKKGLEIDEIVSKVEDLKNKIHIFGFTDSPDWLEKGGRLSSTTAKIMRGAQKIGIRPLLTLKKGFLKATGLKLKAKDKNEALLRELRKRIGGKKINLIISQADVVEEAEVLKDKIETEFFNVNILSIEEMCVVIGAHIGPGAILLAFIFED